MVKKRRPVHTSRPTGDPAAAQAAGQPEAVPADPVQLAWEELQRAEEAYQRVLQGDSSELGEEVPLSAGDVLDASLEFVRHHPAAGVLAAWSIGFLLGRAIPR